MAGPHKIPEVYGAVEPTAIFVPLEQVLASKEAFEAVTTEVFGPFQAGHRFKTCVRTRASVRSWLISFAGSCAVVCTSLHGPDYPGLEPCLGRPRAQIGCVQA